jgi:predicted  nucleic acid-binding Zn-ribbon protein
MLEAVEKLLILQDHDRRLLRLQAELANVEPQRRLVLQRRSSSEEAFESARQAVLHLETERKRLELDTEAQKALIIKYSAQQWQTRKNEEYKALTHEIEGCQAAIRKLDDQQLEVMERLEAAERNVAAATEERRLARADTDAQILQLATTETRLQKQLADAQATRSEFAATVDPLLLPRYERLLKTKGDKIIVSVERGVCGGCHMKLARQDVINTQAGRDLVQCPNCGRILYYLAGMDVKHAE